MPVSEIHTTLGLFQSIGIEKMDDVRLMNRVEIKYVFSSAELNKLLERLSTIYKVLEIDGTRLFPYNTTYLDTPDFLFYTQQTRGKLNRHKVRYREYSSTRLSFLEIKKKTNKNRTIKWRIKNSLAADLHNVNAKNFLKEYLPDDLPGLQPVLINGFTRITLVNEEFKERITLDSDITFASPGENCHCFPFLAIAELKREKHSGQSPFTAIMKETGIHPAKFSKYCVGSALVRDMPRKNNIKQKLMLINKIENEYIKSTGS